MANRSGNACRRPTRYPNGQRHHIEVAIWLHPETNSYGVVNMVPVQMYHVWVFYATDTAQYYYTASLKHHTPANVKNITIHFTVRARSEHDAIARVMMEGYATKDRY
jgi:hypothetical protein